jgi:hypothetical protein
LFPEIVRDNFYSKSIIFDIVANLGISRKVLESQVLSRIEQVSLLNTEENSNLVDDFITKYIILVGTVCSDTPANVPTLIKNGVIPAILKSVEQRLPNSSDMLTGLIFSLNQIILNTEGQELVKNTTIFAKIIESAMDEKLCKYAGQAEHSSIRANLCNFFDRNAEYKEISKQVVIKFVEKIKEISYQFAIKAILISRQVELSLKEKQVELNKLKEDVTFS